jgi:hemerythrin superfamily protein
MDELNTAINNMISYLTSEIDKENKELEELLECIEDYSPDEIEACANFDVEEFANG